MKIENIKGKIIAIEEHLIIVVSDIDKTEIVIEANLSKEYCIGQQVKMLIKHAEESSGMAKIINETKIKASKPVLIKNFSSLINQMNKAHKRLSRTLELAIENEADEETSRYLREKVEYLEVGIDLFSH